MKILVVAAWEPELSRLRERLAEGEQGGVEVVLETLGVGLVEGAISTTRCVARHRPDGALLIGTCGAFGAAGIATGSVVAGEGVRLTDAGVALGASALPAPMPAHEAFDVGLHDALVAAGARSVQIANTVGITVDDALAARLAAGGASDVEHLEAFAFARACAREGVPCAALLAVANAVGATGRAEWLANHVRASTSAADLAYEALGALVSTLALRSSTRARSPERA